MSPEEAKAIELLKREMAKNGGVMANGMAAPLRAGGAVEDMAAGIESLQQRMGVQLRKPGWRWCYGRQRRPGGRRVRLVAPVDAHRDAGDERWSRKRRDDAAAAVRREKRSTRGCFRCVAICFVKSLSVSPLSCIYLSRAHGSTVVCRRSTLSEDSKAGAVLKRPRQLRAHPRHRLVRH